MIFIFFELVKIDRLEEVVLENPAGPLLLCGIAMTWDDRSIGTACQHRVCRCLVALVESTVYRISHYVVSEMYSVVFRRVRDSKSSSQDP